MKAAAIIDMPECCILCPFHDKDNYYCWGAEKWHSDYIDNYETWCPLKPLEENYISIDWFKQNIPFQNEEDQSVLLSMLDAWRKENESNIRNGYTKEM